MTDLYVLLFGFVMAAVAEVLRRRSRSGKLWVNIRDVSPPDDGPLPYFAWLTQRFGREILTLGVVVIMAAFFAIRTKNDWVAEYRSVAGHLGKALGAQQTLGATTPGSMVAIDSLLGTLVLVGLIAFYTMVSSAFARSDDMWMRFRILYEKSQVEKLEPEERSEVRTLLSHGLKTCSTEYLNGEFPMNPPYGVQPHEVAFIAAVYGYCEQWRPVRKWRSRRSTQRKMREQSGMGEAVDISGSEVISLKSEGLDADSMQAEPAGVEAVVIADE